MFESVKQGDRRNGLVYLTSLLTSLMAHAVILCLVILVPMVCFSSLQADELLTILIEPPPPPPAPPPPTPPPVANAAAGGSRTITITGDAVPQRIPTGIPAPDDDPIDPGSLITSIPGAPGGTRGGTGPGSALATLLKDGPIVVPNPPPPPGKPIPIRVGRLEPSKLVRKVSPVYPELARRAHVSGAVILEAVVNEEGDIDTIKVLSGHPLLVNAAVDAVKEWKYSPTILNGEPVSIIATVTVEFHLN
jgi:periplasmic protein TonB